MQVVDQVQHDSRGTEKNESSKGTCESGKETLMRIRTTSVYVDDTCGNLIQIVSENGTSG